METDLFGTLEIISFSSTFIYFFFWSKCLRWGPTSLQTVKMNVCEVFTVCTQLGAGDQNRKYINVLKLQKGVEKEKWK